MYLMSTPYFEMKVDTFCITHCSATVTLLASGAKNSFGIPSMTWIPDLPSALSTHGSASNSFTLSKPLSLSSRTTISGGSGCDARVPQLTPSASAWRKRWMERRRRRRNKKRERRAKSIYAFTILAILIDWGQMGFLVKSCFVVCGLKWGSSRNVSHKKGGWNCSMMQKGIGCLER